MSSFGKLTDYFNRRRSREELRDGRIDSRRSGSCCCTAAEARSLEQKLQRPLLAKSRTLPSIPQSPTVSRLHCSDLLGSGHELTPSRRMSLLNMNHLTKCMLPPAAGLVWRPEDSDSRGGETEVTQPYAEAQSASQTLYSHIHLRAAYLQKSFSVDHSLGMVDFDVPAPEEKSDRGTKVKLKRKCSLGSADRKEGQQKSSSKMNQQMPEHPVATARKSGSLSSPSAARRLYRNLSGKFRLGNPGMEDGMIPGQLKSAVFQNNEALFEAVEHQEMGMVQTLLSQYSLEELDLNTPNSEGLLPLDIAVMTNNVPMAKLLLQAGAKESPHFLSMEGRATHLAALLREAEQRVTDLQVQVAGEGPGDQKRQLKAWDWRLRLFRRMKTGFEHAGPPGAPCKVHLTVSNSSSLRVTFQEPLNVNSAVVTKYKVEWSSGPSLCPLLGEAVLEDTRALQFTIAGLVPGTQYYVQVSAYNMKGWSPPQTTVPACAIPSSWRELDGRAPRQRGQKEVLDQLLGQIKEAHQHCTCHEQCKAPTQARKHSVSKSLRYLFLPNSKFVKNLKRGLYLTSVFYRDDSVLVTSEDHIPVVEIDDSYSSSLSQDFLWFTKMSYLWEEIPWLQQCLSSFQSSCSCTLQTRLRMLQAAAQLQGMLGTQDLGRVYFEPIKDKHGNALLVTLQDMNSSPSLDGMRWTQLCRLQLQRKSVSSQEQPTALDMLLVTLHEKLAYHRRSRQTLSPGLYLGYLKLSSSVDQIQVLVPQKLPNVLCHVKVRDSCHVSREEWQWLQALNCFEESLEMDQNVHNAAHHLLQDLRSACKELIAHIKIPVNQAQDFRIYSQEVLEFSEKVSFLLLLPPSDDVCTAPGQNSPHSLRSGFLTLPLQIFELVHFHAYYPSFIGQYCRVSALLDLESLMSQQTLREAFSESEMLAAKQKHQQVQEHTQQMEEVWRETRWIMDALQYARYKQPAGGIFLGWIIDFSQVEAPEKPSSSSSQLDFLPSPVSSPELSYKHSYDFHRLSDEEVFLATDSDCDSSCAQSQLDLLPMSLCPSAGALGGRQEGLRDPAPDMFLDGDFVLPSRQIELLRVTERRQALFVRTSSLDIPPVATPASLCGRRSRPGPGRSLSEDLSEPTAISCRKGSHITLRVYPQYVTGLPKDISIKLHVTQHTSTREVIRLVVQETNETSRRLLGSPERCTYGEEQLKHFGLVLVADDREKLLQDDLQQLELQSPWVRGKLCVRLMEPTSPALQPNHIPGV